MSLTLAGLLISCLILAWFAHRDFINKNFCEGFTYGFAALLPVVGLAACL